MEITTLENFDAVALLVKVGVLCVKKEKVCNFEHTFMQFNIAHLRHS